MIKTDLFFVNSNSIPSYSSMSNLFFRNINKIISSKYAQDLFRTMTTLFRTLRNLSVKNQEAQQTEKAPDRLDEEFIQEKEHEMLNSTDSRNTVSLVLPRFVLFCLLSN